MFVVEHWKECLLRAMTLDGWTRVPEDTAGASMEYLDRDANCLPDR